MLKTKNPMYKGLFVVAIVGILYWIGLILTLVLGIALVKVWVVGS